MFLVRKACVWNADTVIKCLQQSLQNSSQKITRLASDSWVLLLQPLLFVSFQEKELRGVNCEHPKTALNVNREKEAMFTVS